MPPVFFKLTGGPEWIDVSKGARILAPKMSGSGTGLRGDEINESLSESMALAAPVSGYLVHAAEDTECKLKHVVRIEDLKAPDRGNDATPPASFRFRSDGDGDAAGVLMVVHELGHITWHLRIERAGRSIHPEGEAFEYLIPHIDPTEEGPEGLFGRRRSKVIAEFRFPLHRSNPFNAFQGELFRKIVGVVEDRLITTSLSAIVKKENEIGTQPIDHLPRHEKRTRVLLLVHGTISSTVSAFGDLIKSATWGPLTRNESGAPRVKQSSHRETLASSTAMGLRSTP